MKLLSVFIAVCFPLVSQTAEVGTSRVVVDTAERTVTIAGPAEDSNEFLAQGTGPAPQTKARGEVLWEYADAVAIPRNVSITPDGSYIWVFQELNGERLQLFRIESNEPLWEFSLSHFSGVLSGSVDSWVGETDTLLAARIHDSEGFDTLYVNNFSQII